MMQSELLQPLWPYLNQSDELSSVFVSPGEFLETSNSYPFSTMFSGDFEQLADCDDFLKVTSLSAEEFPMDLGGFEANYLIEEMESIYAACLEGTEGSPIPNSQQFSVHGNDVWSPNSLMTSEASCSMDVTSVQQQSLTLPREEMEISNELSILHLLKAVAEAMEMGQRELKEVILRCLGEKVTPLGQPLERLAFNLCQELDDQRHDYLKQEASKNFETAFNLFYQIFPYGKFAHYAANTAILEAVPEDVDTVHILEFDMGEGVQLSQLIEAVANKSKAMKVTSIKWEDDEESDNSVPQWRFEETKKQLQLHARSFGLNLKMEEIEIENLVSEVKRGSKRGGGREFLAFNCMAGLPHMRRSRSRGLVIEFLRLAKDLLASNRGIITLGDGDICTKLGYDSNFGSFFDGCLVHYQALLESIENNFPSHLTEARTVMECMLVAPLVSSQVWFQKWNEVREDGHLQPWLGLEGKRMSRESYMEAKEIVGQESSYEVRIGENGNEIALEYNGTPLVIVSSWTNQS